MYVTDVIPSAAELRAAAEGYRDALRGTRPTPPPRTDPDASLLDPVSAPFETVAGTLERLAELERRLRVRGDDRAVFLTVYVSMTDAIRRDIEAGAFRDEAWMRAYLVAFANYYREAFLADERGRRDAVPRAWTLAFDAARGEETLVLQDALLGVNAHINHDLTYTLCDVGTTPARAAKAADHRRVNAVLSRLVDAVQRGLARSYDAAGIGAVDELFGSLDEFVTLTGLKTGRDVAWQNAVVRSDVPWRPIEALVEWRVRLVSVGGAHILLRPTRRPDVRDALRAVEAGTAREDVRAAIRDAAGSDDER